MKRLPAHGRRVPRQQAGAAPPMSTHSIYRRALATSFAAAAFLLGSLATAGAQTTQTTVTLNAPTTQVTDVMVQGGVSANTNFNTLDQFATRASTNYDYLPPALAKVDDQNRIPAAPEAQAAGTPRSV